VKTPWSGRTEELEERFSGPKHVGVREEIASMMDNPRNVLNVGCGPNYLKKHLGCECIGLDFEDEWPGVDVVADARNLPFGDDAFDTAVAKNVLQHLSSYRKALSEMMRVARKRIVLAERTWERPTEVVSVNESGVIQRRFNRADLMSTLKGWGEASFKLSKADSRVGIYLGEASY